MVRITKPYFCMDEATRAFKNLMGEQGSIIYLNARGAMVRLEDNREVFVPKGAYKAVKNN